MNLIVCVQKRNDDRWSIGNKGKLLFKYAEDTRLFQQQTIGKVIIMGHNTFDSLPTFLKNRVHIVLSTKDQNSVLGKKKKTEPLIVCNNYSELFNTINKIKKDLNYDDDMFWIIGGETIYKDLVGYCNTAVITSVRNRTEQEADAFFPNLDLNDDWKCSTIQVSEHQPLTFYRYVNNNVKQWNNRNEGE